MKDLILQLLLAHLKASMEGTNYYIIPTEHGPIIQNCIDRGNHIYIRVTPQGGISCLQKVGPQCADWRVRAVGHIIDFYG